MAIFLFSTNMKLKKLVEDATSWWAEWEYNFDRIDSHDHSPNKGKQLAGASLTANDDYYFGSVTINQDPNKNFILLGKKSADPNPAIPTDRGYLYAKDDAAGKTNLFFYDEDRNVIQLTREGSIVSGPIRIWDIDKTHELKLTWNEDEAASDRTLNFKVNSGDRTLDMTGNLTVELASIVNQDLSSDAIPTFSKITLSSGADPITANSKTLNIEENSIVNQDLTNDASPTFASLFVSDAGTKKLEFDCTDAANAANRKLNFKVNDADRTLDLTGNLTVTAASTINQDVRTSAKPAFSGVELSEMAAPGTPTNAGILYVTVGNDLHYVKEDGVDIAVTLGGGVGSAIVDDSTAFTLNLKSNSSPDFTANRDLTIDLANVNRSLIISGDSSIDQDVRVASSPTFVTPLLTSAKLADSGIAPKNYLELKWNEDQAADRVLNIVVGAGDRTLTLSGNLDVEAASNINQDVTSDAAPSFAGITLTASVAALTWTLKDNDASALSIGSAGAADIMKIVTLNAAEAVVFADGKAQSATNAAPSADVQFANKKYVDDQILAHDTFLELTDTPAAYATANAIYRVNVGQTAIEESIVTLAEPGANNFTITKGTSILDVQADLTVESTSVINQDVTSDASPTFASPIVTTLHIDNELYLDDPVDSSHKITMKAPALTGAWTLTLPADDGDAGEVLTTDGSGNATWEAAPAPSINDQGTAFNLTLASNSDPDFTAGRTLTFDLANAARTLTIAGTSKINQDVQTTASPTFAKPHMSSGIELEDPGVGANKVTLQAPTLAGDYTLTLPVDDGTANQILKTDGSGVLSWVDQPLPEWIDSGTAFKLTMASDSTPDYTASRVITWDTENIAATLRGQGLAKVLPCESYLVSGDMPAGGTVYGWHLNSADPTAAWTGGITLTESTTINSSTDHLGNTADCDFDGGDYLYSDDVNLAATGDFSEACWFYRSSWASPGTTQGFIGKLDATSQDGFALQVYTDGSLYWATYSGGVDSSYISKVSTTSLTAGWHHFAFSRTSGSQTYLYIDGKWAGSTTSAAMGSAGRFTIGAIRNGDNKTTGRLSEVVYHKGVAWSESDVRKIYARGARRFAALDQSGWINIPQNETIAYPRRTITVTGNNSWVTTSAYAYPFVDICGNWHVWLSIYGSSSAVAVETITISTVSFLGFTSLGSWAASGTGAAAAYNTGATTIQISTSAGGTANQWMVSGILPLSAKPNI